MTSDAAPGASSEARSGAWSGRLSHLWWGLTGSAVILLLGGAVAWFARGGAGVAGFAAGVGLVTASYSVSSLVIAWADRIAPALILPFGLTTYAVKFTVIGVLMASVSGSGWPGLVPLGIGVVVAAFGWSAAQILWVVRTQHPYR